MKIALSSADAATLLARAIRQSAGAHGVVVETVVAIDRPWASATFEGTRHEIRLSLTGSDPRAWLAILPEAELPMRGHILADLAVDGVDGDDAATNVRLTALTLAER